MSSSEPPPPELMIGAAFVGGVVQVFLVGLVTVQTFIFFKTNNNVHYINKWAVFMLWVMAILHISSVIHVTYHYLVTKRGNTSGSEIVWTYLLLLTNLTQILYAVRLWQLTKGALQRALLFTVVGSLIGLNLALNIYIPFKISSVKGLAEIPAIEFKWAVKLDFSVTSLIDCILSIALVHSLANSGRRLDWTEKNFDVILAYALNTGIFASVFSITCPITYALMDNMVFLALRIILTGLYVNSLLAMLNARYYFQKSDDSNATLNPTAPSQTSVLLYNGRGFDRQLHASSTSPANKATINEIGLPLFQPRPERHQVVNDSIQLMEVKVTKERLAQDG